MAKKEHGGNLYKIRKKAAQVNLIDFSANINPLGPPDWLRSIISREVENIAHYPDPDCTDFINVVADYHQIKPEMLLSGNGTSELLYYLLQIIKCTRVVIPVPSYIDYSHAAIIAKKNIEKFYLVEEENFNVSFSELDKELKCGDCLILGLPNNPTGVLPDLELLKELITTRNDITFILDEAFLGFCEGKKSLAGFADNVITLNSMTKLFAIPGIRLGYCSAKEDIIAGLKEVIPAWSVNHFAQKIGIQAFQSKEYKKRSVAKVNELRLELYQSLIKYDQFVVYQSSVNYHLCKLVNGSTAKKLKDELLKKGLIIRVCDNYDGLDETFFRIAVKSKKENDQLLVGLDQVFKRKRSKLHKKTPSLMIQGTCSNAGKSIVTAALCRIFLQDGINVCPFKAQNMSLNSFVTVDGGEMGRAQVVQAQAAKLLPDWRMNPVLLKPNSDTGSQVIVHGKPVGNMNVKGYHQYKKEAWQKITEAYDSLSVNHDLMLLEGAGSPGEVNLKQNDIVNMKMAEYANSPVLLVGDIDRGGVYASFVGIMEVLEEWERQLVSGFIVNKFRGDASLLESAHSYVKRHTDKDVFGVIPHLNDLGLPEEDSVSFKIGSFKRDVPARDHVVIGGINLPHISNFTDFEPFLDEPDVHLKIIDNVEDITGCDAIILPGSKNVIGDLIHLKENGIAEAVLDFAKKGKQVVGICGGYQMLGKQITDIHNVESDSESINCLGLLEIVTEMSVEKCLNRKQGIHRKSESPICGYEIHHGISSTSIENTLFKFDDNSCCGQENTEGNVWGGYLHGLFDSDTFRRWFIDEVRVQKGMNPLKNVVHNYSLEDEFERLAATVRENVDMDRIYSLINL